jgi:hypothetical protein
LAGGSRTEQIVRDNGRAHLLKAVKLAGREPEAIGTQIAGELVGSFFR